MSYEEAAQAEDRIRVTKGNFKINLVKKKTATEPFRQCC